MRRFFVLLISTNILWGLSFGQTHFVLSGVVADESNQPLAGATVFLLPANSGAITDVRGAYKITQLQKGTYTIRISFIGYSPVTDTIRLDGDATYNARMETAALSLQEVIVTDNRAELRKREESLSMEIVNGGFLKQNLGGSLMNSLERLPGVTTMDIGSGQSKPVIRGLGFNRILVAENSIKHEAQQWGTDHGLEIDQYAVDQVEVIKGPASLVYGSDAIGGVIDLKRSAIPVENSLGGSVDLTGKTNSDFLGTSLLLYGRRKGFFADARITWVDYGDYVVPADSVDIYSYRAALYRNQMRNTAGNELNLHLSLGVTKNRFLTRIFISHIHSKGGFFANAHGLEPRNVDSELHDKSDRDILYPYHSVNHFKIVHTAQYDWANFRFESSLGVQQNFRQEWSPYVVHGYMPAIFPDTLHFRADLERQFEKQVYSGNLKLTRSVHDNTEISLGIAGEYQENRIDGRSFIIPAFVQFNTGSYVLVKYAVSERSQLQAGIRYDFGRLSISGYTDWFPSPVVRTGDTLMQYLERAGETTRNFSNITGSIGYSYNPQNWSFKLNIGKSFRMPIAKELAANGVNYHHFSYEVGDADLSPEISWQLDAGIEYSTKRFAIGTTPFLNYFSNYIYLNPSSEHDRLYGNGNQVYYYTQSRVIRYGAEIHAHIAPVRFLQVGIIAEYVNSRQLSGAKKGFGLPFSPPASAILNIKYQKQKLKYLENIYVSFDFRVSAPQNDIVPPEETTDGFFAINLGMGCGIRVRKQFVHLTFQVRNLSNAKYFNHTSYYRLIHVPEQGRDFILNLSIPFSLKMNNV